MAAARQRRVRPKSTSLISHPPFDEPVLQAVKSDDCNPPAHPQQPGNLGQCPLQLTQLVVDRNPQRLKRARSRMDLLSAAPAHNFRHDFRQSSSGHDRAVGDDGTCDGAALSLLSVPVQNLGDLLPAPAV